MAAPRPLLPSRLYPNITQPQFFLLVLSFLLMLGCCRSFVPLPHQSSSKQYQRHSKPCTLITTSIEMNQNAEMSNQVASASTSSKTLEQQQRKQVIRILALHGSGGTADSFTETIQKWQSCLTQSSQQHHDDHQLYSNLELQITAVAAPHGKGQGFAWWNMPDGVRSFNASVYEGYEESCQRVEEQWTRSTDDDKNADNNNNDEPPFDLVVGHSQGAILTMALLSTRRYFGAPHHPRLGYILNGVAWPNPYTQELESLRLETADTASAKLQPRVLMLVGERDDMNPPAQAQRVQVALQGAGFAVQVVSHPRGHAVPVPNEEDADKDQTDIVETILTWIAEGIKD